MAEKKYLAMCQVYEYEKDAEGKVIYCDVPNSWALFAGAPVTIKRPKSVKVEGKFRAFGAHGKVVSLYDSPAKAKRYCGKEGHVVEMDPDDCRRLEVTLEEQMTYCENRMLFWAAEADRLQKEIRGNG